MKLLFRRRVTSEATELQEVDVLASPRLTKFCCLARVVLTAWSSLFALETTR